MNFAQVKGISIPQGTVKQLAQGQTVLWKKQESGEIWPPDTYTRLAALKRTNQNAYFNTGVIADSTTDSDVYFYNDASTSSSSFALYGIRRASGSGDSSRYAVYNKPSASWSGFAVNFDGTDTRAITGGGFACKFGGALTKISCRGGKWYEWDRLIYDGSASTFSNADNTPVFLGLLAKTSSTVYGTSSLQLSFTEAVFYDSLGNVAHRFLPYKDGSNQMGFWDTIVGEFKLVNNQSHWTAVADHTYRSLRVHSYLDEIRSSGSYQSCVRHNGWTVAIQDGQRYFVLTNERYEIHTGTTLSQSGYVISPTEYNSNWHGNTSWFGSEKADPDDFFPLLYVGTDKTSHLLTVYRLAGSDPTTCTISLVQKIYTPEGDSYYGSTLYYHNYYGKPGCSTFIQAAFTKNSYSSNTGDYEGNVFMYRVFNLPALSAGSEVTLLETDALAKGDIGFISTGQNGGWNGKYWLVTTINYVNFYEIDGNGATLVLSINHASTSSADYITNLECEGFSWYEQGGYFVAMWEPGDGHVYDAYADDLKPYAIGTYNFGQ